MADSGHNSYVAVRPDGTVDVATQVDVNGAISAYNFLKFFEPSVLIQEQGDDVTAAFTLDNLVSAALLFSGTGYVDAGGVVAYLDFYIDDVYVGSQPHPFNQAGLQLTFEPFAWAGYLAAGDHSVRIAPGGNLSRDPNDNNTVLLIAAE